MEVPHFDTSQDTAIKKEYVIYIQAYGFPDDGIFLETRLQEIRLALEKLPQ